MANNLSMGIALKKTKFETKSRFFSAVLNASRFCDFVFVDYEGAQELLSPSDVATLLNVVDSRLVLTIGVRGSEFHRRDDLLQQYLRLSREFDNFHFCFVPGHPAYQSVDKTIPLDGTLHRFITLARQFTSAEIFFGVENVPLRIMKSVTGSHEGIVPFVLNGERRVSAIAKHGSQLALYSPHATANHDMIDIIERMQGYLLRRKWTWQQLEKLGYDKYAIMTSHQWRLWPTEVKQVMTMALDHFILTTHNLETRLREFMNHGITHLVLNPIVPEAVLH